MKAHFKWGVHKRAHLPSGILREEAYTYCQSQDKEPVHSSGGAWAVHILRLRDMQPRGHKRRMQAGENSTNPHFCQFCENKYAHQEPNIGEGRGGKTEQALLPWQLQSITVCRGDSSWAIYIYLFKSKRIWPLILR